VVGCTIELLKVPTKEPPGNAKHRESKAEAADFLAELDADH
jgi:hypothetical protein